MNIVLFSIFFIISIGIGIYFVYYKYMSRNEKNVSKYDMSIKQQFSECKSIEFINGKSQRIKH